MTMYDVTNTGQDRLSIIVEADNEQEAIEEATYVLDSIDMTDLTAFETDE